MTTRTMCSLSLVAFGLLMADTRVASGQAQPIALDRPDSVTPVGGAATAVVDYKGRRALKLTRAPDSKPGDSFVMIKDVAFGDGTIEVDVAGTLAANADPSVARGFIGVAFRVGPEAAKYEYIYLRPTNGRAEDQVRRNHATQYASHPDYPFSRMRKESPEKYESYVDLEVGVWTSMKIVVKGTTARLFVHDAAQPCLIVNDLKLGTAEGGIGLFSGPGTEGYYSNLRVTR